MALGSSIRYAGIQIPEASVKQEEKSAGAERPGRPLVPLPWLPCCPDNRCIRCPKVMQVISLTASCKFFKNLCLLDHESFEGSFFTSSSESFVLRSALVLLRSVLNLQHHGKSVCK